MFSVVSTTGEPGRPCVCDACQFIYSPKCLCGRAAQRLAIHHEDGALGRATTEAIRFRRKTAVASLRRSAHVRPMGDVRRLASPCAHSCFSHLHGILSSTPPHALPSPALRPADGERPLHCGSVPRRLRANTPARGFSLSSRHLFYAS